MKNLSAASKVATGRVAEAVSLHQPGEDQQVLIFPDAATDIEEVRHAGAAGGAKRRRTHVEYEP